MREHASPDRDRATLLLHALVVGALAGSAAIALRLVATALPTLIWPHGADLVASVAAAPVGWRIAIPVLGALAAGGILSLGARWAGAAQGWDILEAVVLRDGLLPWRPSLTRCASSLITQASAGAVGREGPIVLLAAATASAYGQRSRMHGRDLRVLAGCGIAAGLTCAYNAPLGAALFALEIVFGSVALDVLAPLVVSSGVATVMAWAAFGHAPVFHVPSMHVRSPWDIAGYAVLGVAGGAAGALFLTVLRTASAVYTRLSLPRPIAMATAGLALGVTIVWFPELVGNGREAVAALFARPWGLGHVAALVALRLLVTPLAVGAGTVGGVFTPTLFLGAMLGQAFGLVLAAVAPGTAPEPAAFALVGMAALVAGSTHAPLTSAVLVFEMTLDYSAIVPLLLTSVIASLVASRFSRDSIYTESIRRKAAAARDTTVPAGTLRVSDVARPDHVVVDDTCPLAALIDAFVAARRNHLYLVAADGRFQGAVNIHDATAALQRHGASSGVTASTLAWRDFPVARLDEPLGDVLDRFEGLPAERLPVVEPAPPHRLVGTVSKRDILAAYALRLLGRSAGTARSSDATQA
jgi:chloride channel protein, CIC family